MKAWKYIYAAFNARWMGIFVPPNWIALGVIGLLGAFVNPGFWLIGAGVELAYLFVLSSNASFRHDIDSAESDRSREESAARVKKIVSALDGGSQAAYQSLVARCNDIIRNSDAGSFDKTQIGEGLDRLLWIYIRLLKTTKQLAAAVDDSAGRDRQLRGQIAQLEKDLHSDLSDDLRASKEATLNTLRARLAIQSEAKAKLEYSRAELQRIEGEVDRAREQSLISTEPVAVTRQVDAITSGLGVTNDWIKQQQDIFGEDDLSGVGPIVSIQ
jgi:hypothetical protein